MEFLLRAQTDIVSDLQGLLRDASAARWTATEGYRAINMALGDWQGRVSVPALYAPDDLAWSSTSYEYDLPAYIDEHRMQPQYQSPLYEAGVVELPGAVSTWVDLWGWKVEPTAAGLRKLRFTQPPPDAAGRIVHWVTPRRIPTATTTLSGTLAAGAASVTLNSAVDCDDVGWLKIDGEYMGYSGVTRGASSTVLSNLVRGLMSSTDASHSTSAVVAWCVAHPRADVLNQLYNRAMVWMHTMFMGNASPQERDVHGQMIRLHGQIADEFWKKWQPMRAPRFVIGQRAIHDRS